MQTVVFLIIFWSKFFISTPALRGYAFASLALCANATHHYDLG